MPPDTAFSFEISNAIAPTAFGMLCEGSLARGGERRPMVYWIGDEAISADPDRLPSLRATQAQLARIESDVVLPVQEFVRVSGRLLGLIGPRRFVPLGRLIGDEEPIPLSVVLNVAQAVASALDACWRQPPKGQIEPLRLAHRDIRPSTVLFGTRGEILVAGFGLAPSVEPDDPLGSRYQKWASGYLAPEQAEGAPPDPTMDVYSLGATLYEVFARRPLGPLPARAVRHRMLVEERLATLPVGAGSPEIEREIRDLLTEMLAFRAEDRPTASELAEWLSSIERPLPASCRMALGDFARSQVEEALEEGTPKPAPEGFERPLPFDGSLRSVSFEGVTRTASTKAPSAPAVERAVAASSPGPVAAAPETLGGARVPVPARPARPMTGLVILGLILALSGLLVADTFLGFLPIHGEPPSVEVRVEEAPVPIAPGPENRPPDEAPADR